MTMNIQYVMNNVQYYIVVFITTLFYLLCARIRILLACEEHSYKNDRIISPRREVWAYETSLIPPLFIEMHSPS